MAATLLLLPRPGRSPTLSLLLLRRVSTRTSPQQHPVLSTPIAPPHAQLPYFVPRTTSGTALPVYQEQRQQAGPLTVIKHVRGDLNALAKDLQTELLPEGAGLRTAPSSPAAGTRRPRKQIQPIAVDERKRQIILRGQWRKVINDWFVGKGF